MHTIKQMAAINLSALLLLGTSAWTGTASAATFQWLDAKHRLHSLSEYRGRPLILHLWASWCPPCRQELPALAVWMQAHPKIAVLPISLDEAAAAATNFLHRQHIGLPLLLADPDEAAALGVRVLPTSFIIDSRGNIRRQLIGAQPWTDPKFSSAILDRISRYAPLSARR